MSLMAKKRVKRAKSRKVVKVSNSVGHDKRIKLGLKNFVVFVLLSVISLALEKISDYQSTLNIFFGFTKWIFTWISVAFLIVVLVSLLMRGFKKK
jgi:hypothetical protein